MVAGEPAENCDVPAPVIANGGRSVTAKPLVFVIVTGKDVGDPDVTTPKLRLVGFALSVAAMMPIVYDASPEQLCASVARMVTEYDPAAVGEPDTVPDDPSNSPGGSAPEDVVNV
jgi:hypothetical protein